jgi:serine/threonine protein kinase
MAPEALGSQVYSVKTDVYSYGVTLWEMITRKVPFADMDYTQVAINVHRGLRLPIPSDAPQPFAELMRECWAQAPDARPDFVTITKFWNGALPTD